MPSSNVNIWNQALIALGSNQIIVSEDEASVPAQSFNTIYWDVVDQLLAKTDWEWAEHINGPLNQLVGDNPFCGRYKYWFQEPADLVYFKELSHDGDTHVHPAIKFHRWRDPALGKVFATDEATPHIRYTYKVRDPQQFSPGFVGSLKYLLASHVALKITSQPELVGQMGQAYQRSLSEAGTELANIEEKPRDASWVDARE